MTATQADSHQEWLDWRMGGVGASDVAAAATGRYGGATKAVAARLGIEADEITLELADRGHRWEEPIVDMIRMATGFHVVGEQTWLEHPDNRRRRATVDGFLAVQPELPIDDVSAVLEIKTRQPFAPWPWDYWTAQTQVQMDIAGLDRCLLAIATIDQVLDSTTLELSEQMVDLKLRWIDADPLAQADLALVAEQLLDQIDAGVLPEPVDHLALPYVAEANRIAAAPIPCGACDGTGKDGRRRCLECDGKGGHPVTADIDDLADLIERYDELTDAAQRADEERKTARARLIHRMGAATEAVTTDGAWRVRLGVPKRELTRDGEDEFIARYCMHRPDCPPDCDRHRPDLLDARLNTTIAIQEGYGDELDEAKHPTPVRRLTIKRLTPEESE